MAIGDDAAVAVGTDAVASARMSCPIGTSGLRFAHTELPHA